MRKIVYLSLITLLSFQLTFAQQKEKKTEDWNIPKPTQKLTNAKFSKIIIQDLRLDKEDMGFVQKGAFNRYTLIKPIIPLKKQIEDIFNDLIVKDSFNKNELIVQIRDFYFSELTSGMSEEGKFKFRATIFAGEPQNYKLIKKVDEVYKNSSMDVTLQLERESGELILKIISEALVTVKPLEERIYTLEDIDNFEGIEKNKLALYTNDKYVDGIYKDFQSFSMQIPSMPIHEVKEGNNTIKVYYLNENKKSKNARGNYAAIYQGKLYINNGEEFIKLTKKENDYYFYGYVSKKASFGKQLGVGVATGVLTSLLTGGFGVAFFPTTDSVLYEFKMDFLNGSFIPIQEVKQKK